MQKKPIISILVPLFNREKTIGRCLDSLNVQEPSIYEIIVLDDGSTDSGYQIAQDYAKKYEFIRVYHQDNHGVAATRQKLITLAQGNYIMFCDSDDYFAPDAISVVYSILKNQNIDAILFGYNLIRAKGEKNIYGRQLTEGIHLRDEFSALHVNGFKDLYWSSLWNKCYKTELFISPEKIKFEKLMEDVLCNFDYFSRCKQIYIINKPLYNYVQIGESLTRSKRADTYERFCETRQIYLALYEKMLQAYPEEGNHVISNRYILTRKLIRRAAGIGEKALEKELRKECRALRSSLGIKTYLLDCSYILSIIKEKVKALLNYY